MRIALDVVTKSNVILDRPLRIVHGDFSYTNLIFHENRICVIDHECMHIDHRYFDYSHFLLDLCCSGYFAGELDIERIAEYLDAIRDLSASEIYVHEIALVAVYVLLKKIALVSNPDNLFVSERSRIIRDLLEVYYSNLKE